MTEWVPMEDEVSRPKDDIQIPFSSTDGGAASASGTYGKHWPGQRYYIALWASWAHGAHKMRGFGSGAVLGST